MTYAELKTNIADYLHRTDLTDKIPLFVTLAESSLFRSLDVKELETVYEDATDEDYASLPPDFGALSKITISTGGRETTLDYLAGADQSSTPHPTHYAYENGQIRIYGAGSGVDYKLYYKAKLTPLSNTVQSNWLLQNAADLYLYAGALEAAKYLRNAGEVALLGPLVNSLLESVKSKISRTGLPSSGSLRITPRR